MVAGIENLKLVLATVTNTGNQILKLHNGY